MVTNCKNAVLYILLKESHNRVSCYTPEATPDLVVRNAKKAKKVHGKISAKMVYWFSSEVHEACAVSLC